MSPLRPLLALLLVPLALAAQGGERRPISLDDLARFRHVGDPQLSPDGLWVAYTVGTTDTAADRQVRDVWMTSWDGRTTLQLTRTPKESESTPRWSPDGQWLSFLSDRGNEEAGVQLWLLSRRGGEAEQVTRIKTGIDDYAWSPDGRRLVMVIEDGDSVEAPILGSPPDSAPVASGGDKKAPPPIVIDRFYFKEDYTGYVRRKRKHLYLFTLATRALEPLTPGGYDERLPAWSPDGQYLVFASKRDAGDPDRHDNWDLWIIQAAVGAVPRQLTTFSGPDNHPDWESHPAWSPDGRFIAYVQGGPDSLTYYAGRKIAVVPWTGGAPTLLTSALDRNAELPAWSSDGGMLYFRVEDDRSWYLARMAPAGGPLDRVLDGRQVVEEFSIGGGDRVAALITTPDQPAEIFAMEGPNARQLSHQNDSLLASLRLAPMEEISARSRDGTTVNGFLVRPLDEAPSRRAPTILNIHGGPVSEFENEFSFYWQLLAANGYAVVAMNPRGSSGRGEKYSLGIWADWGNRDAQDVLAGVDYAVKQGVADPDLLGVGGWSYGGILTNYVIAQDTRFKAATSGAGASNILAGYGTDMYVREYEAELGTPWKNTATYLKLSFPFLHADRIKTPTLFLGGERDFNVPLLNGEQMYQALRSLGVPTRLIIYPGQFHGIEKPSYQRDRYARYLEWFGRYLKP